MNSSTCATVVRWSTVITWIYALHSLRESQRSSRRSKRCVVSVEIGGSSHGSRAGGKSVDTTFYAASACSSPTTRGRDPSSLSRRTSPSGASDSA